MTYLLTIDLPALGSQRVYIHGLGSFPNGTHTITDEQERNFRVANAVHQPTTEPTTKASYEDDEEPDPYGSPQLQEGPSLLEAVAAMYGVTVTRKDASGGGDD